MKMNNIPEGFTPASTPPKRSSENDKAKFLCVGRFVDIESREGGKLLYRVLKPITNLPEGNEKEWLWDAPRGWECEFVVLAWQKLPSLENLEL